MPRKARSYINSKVLHIMCQGINKEFIFKNAKCKNLYIKYLKEEKMNFKIEIIAYCIMNNHAHILLYYDSIKDVSKFMQKVNCKYAIWYNNNYSRVGYVFRDRFNVIEIMDKRQLITCINYIHDNPVNAKMVSNASMYKFSSYNNYVRNNFNSEVLKVLNLSNLDIKKFIINQKEISSKDIPEKIEEIEINQLVTRYKFDHNIEIIKILNQKYKLKFKEIARLLNITTAALYKLRRDKI